jgi:hypothetical protein
MHGSYPGVQSAGTFVVGGGSGSASVVGGVVVVVVVVVLVVVVDVGSVVVDVGSVVVVVVDSVSPADEMAAIGTRTASAASTPTAICAASGQARNRRKSPCAPPPEEGG